MRKSCECFGGLGEKNAFKANTDTAGAESKLTFPIKKNLARQNIFDQKKQHAVKNMVKTLQVDTLKFMYLYLCDMNTFQVEVLSAEQTKTQVSWV